MINGEGSALSDVLSGIPQGSVLGPVLFLVFINDLPDSIANFVKNFADDTKVYLTVGTISDSDCNKLQGDLTTRQIGQIFGTYDLMQRSANSYI